MKYGNKTTTVVFKLVRATIQKLVKSEACDWPPFTACGLYQPHRPEMTVQDLCDKK